MINWKRGDKNKARECFDTAVEWMQTNKLNGATLQRLRDEAGAVLGIEDDGN